ncbi:TerC family protein [Paenibacillus sp. Marseille-Q4541]|uniref:TerC family protein n=1 Tax=Paenibacillus sp. Marseille-Q4541 TaxID=2831522 RepID=UPI001BA4A461|nr:TerC family protein [Paenibacillus sp. Marseille-Q4541]
MEELWLLAQILMINLVLSGDNAVVIAMASRNLPVHRRRQAVWWGAFGAVLLRCILTFVAVLILGIPYIQAAGGLMLLYIAFKLLFEDTEEVHVRESSTLWSAIQTILVADFVMSLDNVLAIAAIADGDLALIVIGIAISIPIVVWGSGIIVKLLQRYPILVFAGSAILAYTAGEMLLRDPKLGIWLQQFLLGYQGLIPAIFAVCIIISGAFRKLTHYRV